MQFGAIEEFQGLKFKTSVQSDSNVAAIIGRNGSGKTRLLKAIADGKVKVLVNDEVVQPGGIRLLHVGELSPNLLFVFDPVQHKHNLNGAVEFYRTYRNYFDVDPQRFHGAIGHKPGWQSVWHAALRASQVLSKGINHLDDEDIADFFSDGILTTMGSLNVAATMRAYWDRMEQNEFYEFRNHKYDEQNSYWLPHEFQARFGPPPWEVFNDFLGTVLGGRYQVEVPTRQNIAGYSARIYRSDDGLVIDPDWLSSGEKVLMWLCLIMFTSNAGRMADPPKLLLLDEPDSALHPQMVQNLHMVLKDISRRFNSGVMFTTHSPTSVALFDGPIWQISEHDLVDIAKDAAIGELLVGLDQVSIHYTKCKQVYVESHNDEDIYTKLFGCLRRWKKGIAEHISLSFIPAAPKLAEQNVKDLLKNHLGDQDAAKIEQFVQALNGQGNCAQVIGAVESLTAEGGVPVHGIIDWDLVNKPSSYVHVLGSGIFYNIENAILNPLTLGFYLLHNFPSKIDAYEFGLSDGFDLMSLYNDGPHLQSIVDGVMKRVLKVYAVNHDVECVFLHGWRVRFDSRYVHMKGHDLENQIKESDKYPFLKAINKQPTLLMDVVQRGIGASNGRTMPVAFSDLFCEIQAAGT